MDKLIKRFYTSFSNKGYTASFIKYRARAQYEPTLNRTDFDVKHSVIHECIPDIEGKVLVVGQAVSRSTTLYPACLLFTDSN